MKAIYITIFLLAAALPSVAQHTCNIKKAYAFYTLSFPGAQMVDENGKPVNPKPTILRFIYFEWNGKGKPGIATVLYDTMALSAKLIKVKGNSVVPGGEISQHNPARIVVAKNNTLWKIELHPKGLMPEQDCKHIIIKTKVPGKTCSVKLTGETELTGIPRY